MQAVQQVHDLDPFSSPACSTSVVFLVSHVTSVFLGLAGVCLSSGRRARRLNVGFTAWLLDWFLRSSPKTESVLNACKVKYLWFGELWGESVEKTDSFRKAKTDS